MAALYEQLVQALVPGAGAAVRERDMLVFALAPDALLPTVRRLKNEFGFDLLLDVTAVDWMGQTPRFEVVFHLYSTTHKLRVRLKARVG